MFLAITDNDSMAVRLLIYIAGIATTGLGSWVSSKIRVYHDARNSHRDELKQKVLKPLRDAIGSQFMTPLYEITGQQTYNAQASAQEVPVTLAYVLTFKNPGPLVESALDEVLFEDARLNHYQKLICAWEAFSDSWGALVARLQEWLLVIADDLLHSSGLPPHPSPAFRPPYVMHLNLAGFIYQRLMLGGLTSLDIVPEINGQGATLRVAQMQAAAMGSDQQIKDLLQRVEWHMQSQRPSASEIKRELEKLHTSRVSLARQFSLEIAAKKLGGRCSLVRFISA